MNESFVINLLIYKNVTFSSEELFTLTTETITIYKKKGKFEKCTLFLKR